MHFDHMTVLSWPDNYISKFSAFIKKNAYSYAFIKFYLIYLSIVQCSLINDRKQVNKDFNLSMQGILDEISNLLFLLFIQSISYTINSFKTMQEIER